MVVLNRMASPPAQVRPVSIVDLGDGRDFFGATLYRPKDGVMVVTNPGALFGEKTMFGMQTVQRQAAAEGREVICLWPYYESLLAESATATALREHGLLIENDDAQV